ncbi:hypothetical protein DNL40_11975 [Xylanimonas oleitrophica]|uniref:HTH luxR-type domain-containing protein n=2 Tax=Xylanimonas oleitrophica TaxID=2607479 RepID=A0A2W5WN66_9MICO|nr:hypothetical protein DNL40_11975 [Xylanimonas oleitrophica]
MAALNLYRRADDWLAISMGTCALVLGSVSIVAVSIREGTPPTQAVLAGSVPFLLGMLIAMQLHLHDARTDRVGRQHGPAATVATPATHRPHPGPGAPEAAQRAIDTLTRRLEELAATAAHMPRDDPHDRPAMPDLPDREREILRLVSTGASNAAIARNLYLSEATVKQYVSRLMRRFERENRTQLALLAARWFE